MSAYKPATDETVVQVLRNLADFVEKECFIGRRVIAKDVNRFLDDLIAQDYFGAEGQADPRGDHRE